MRSDSTPALDNPISSGLAILRADGSSRLVAQRAFRAGDVILELDGVQVTEPSRHSIQIGIGLHLEKPAYVEGVAEMDRYLWRFLEHSCAPCAAFRGSELVALRTIEPLEPVTFDYLTQEYDMASPFSCACGSPDCVGDVRGFRHLSPAGRERLRPRLAPHVLELARRDGLC
ncbi:MAG: SET domain-containing protein [Planctomycetota bacterium]|nr:SET domain-containing protein [Planctomycetota bacterium]